MNTNKDLVDQLADSELFKEYEQAFSTATGMPVALRALESFDLPFQGKKQENSFCALMAKKNKSCGACLSMQEKLCQTATQKIATAVCDLGICEAAVPVRLGNELIGFLQTGQVLAEPPSEAKLEKVIAKARNMGIEESPETLREAYLKTPVMTRSKFNSTLRLLLIFADLLSIKINQIIVKKANQEHPIVSKAKQYIETNHAEELSLNHVAQAVHVSPFHLCKLFRKSTGITFTEFVSRTRTEKAKNLLLNPQLRISEIVYDVGFQSLTHFNRIFKKLVGESPTQFRARSAGTQPGLAASRNSRPGGLGRNIPAFS
jgi:AraC-like DNA-binding protein/ligand-binding sensor protein